MSTRRLISSTTDMRFIYNAKGLGGALNVGVTWLADI